MRYTDMLLESSSVLPMGKGTIGAMVSASGHETMWSDRTVTVPDVTVIHYSSAVLRCPDTPFALEEVLSLFCEYGVSSHFLIDREGTLFRLVPIGKKAWHCGGSIMPEPDNRRGVNDFSVGIELLATGESGFTTAQYAALAELCAGNERIFGMRMTYVGHDTIAGKRAVALGLRTEEKTDPGSRFEWRRFFDMLASRRVPDRG